MIGIDDVSAVFGKAVNAVEVVSVVDLGVWVVVSLV